MIWTQRILLLAILLASQDVLGEDITRNGFLLKSNQIDVVEILEGGPPRDGIAALDHPAFLPASEAPWHDDETVIGVVLGGKARAYPVTILTWHELVNDTLGGKPLLVSFCPLCGTGIVFDRNIAGKPRTFGVSGLLYRSDMLMYDRETESLWSQIAAKAVTGPTQGARLKLFRSSMQSWASWRSEHPDTTVLSPETGYRRRYGQSPYGNYALTEGLLFPAPQDPRYHNKMPTLGLRTVTGKARAYPASELVRAGGQVSEQFAGQSVEVGYDPDDQRFRVEAPEAIEVVEGFWFAWMAFHPESSVFVAPEPNPRD